MKTPEHEPPAGRVDFGRIVGVHGVRGELKLRPHNPASTLPGDLEAVTLAGSEGTEDLALLAARPHGGNWLVRLEGIGDRNAADRRVGAAVWVAEEDLAPLGDGEYYHRQLVGLAVEDESGAPLGRVRGLLATGASDVLEIVDGDVERLVPMADEFVVAIDLEAGRIVVRPWPGLFD